MSSPLIAEEEAVEPVQQDVRALSLEGCVGYAVYNSFEAKLAKLDLLIAETEIMPAIAVFDTILFGDVDYAEDKRQQSSVFAPDDNQTNIYSIGITKELPTGTELTAAWSDTRSWSNTPFVTKNPSHNAELTLEATYIEVLYAKKALNIFRSILNAATDLYETQKRNYDIGLLERVDLYAVEGNVATREAEFLVAENNYNRARENLKLTMNMNEDVRIFTTDELVSDPAEEGLSDYMKTAFDNRRDYKISKREVKIRGLELKVADNMKWPEIDLVGTMAMNGLEGKFNHAADKSWVADNTYYSAGIEVSMPIENNLARGQYKKAKYEKEKALVNLKEVERTIITQVGNAYNDTIAFQASLIFTKKAVDFELSKYTEEEKRFKYGRSSMKRLIDFQQDLLRAALENARFLFDQRRSKVDLERTMNVLLGKYEETL